MANGAPFFTPMRKRRNQPVNSEAVEKGAEVYAHRRPESLKSAFAIGS